MKGEIILLCVEEHGYILPFETIRFKEGDKIKAKLDKKYNCYDFMGVSLAYINENGEVIPEEEFEILENI